LAPLRANYSRKAARERLMFLDGEELKKCRAIQFPSTHFSEYKLMIVSKEADCIHNSGMEKS